MKIYLETSVDGVFDMNVDDDIRKCHNAVKKCINFTAGKSVVTYKQSYKEDGSNSTAK